MGNQEEFDDREGYDDQGTRTDYGDGCFTDGMGSSLQRRKDRRPVVPVREQEPYQLSRTPGSYVRSEVVCQGQEGQPHPSQNGQQNRSILCQSHGGDTISCAEQACNPTVAMVSREKHITHCRTSTRDGQLHSGQRVQNNPVIGRMAATSGSIQADSGDSGQMQHRSVCNTTQCPTGAVCQLETRPQCSWDGYTTTSLGQMGRLCIPSLLPNWKMPQEDLRRQSISNSRGTGVEVTAVVPGTARSIGGLSLILPKDPMLLIDPFNNPHPLVATGQLQLAAWKLSGIDSKQREFQRKLPNC